MKSLTFQNCVSLEALYLNDNKISVIPIDAFLYLHELVKLSLDKNWLAMIHPAFFRDMHKLQELGLSDNKLTEIPNNAFHHLVKLKELDLHDNKIATITKNMFEQNVLLDSLNLNNNKIKAIQIGSFRHLGYMTYLNLGSNYCIDDNFRGKFAQKIAEGLSSCYPTNCMIPRISYGRVVRVDDNSRQTSGVFVELNMSVKLVCRQNYSTIEFMNLCEKSGWKEREWPECESE